MLLTVTEIAEVLNIKPSTVYTKVRNNELPFYQPYGKGSMLRFDKDEVLKFISGCAVKNDNTKNRG